MIVNSLKFQDSDKFINDLVLPILNCMSDPEVRVRYFASESLYNVVKVARSSIIPLFPKIFSSLSRLVTGMLQSLTYFSQKTRIHTSNFLLLSILDPDENCKNGSELLDRLLKVSSFGNYTFAYKVIKIFSFIQDIVIESSQTFDINGFIPLLRERIYAKNSFARQFIISWISVLNTIPDINMILYLPDILDGLFQMLDDSSVEIHRTYVINIFDMTTTNQLRLFKLLIFKIFLNFFERSLIPKVVTHYLPSF